MTHIHPDKHICVKTFLEFPGQSPPPSIAQNSTTRLSQRISMNLKVAMKLAVSIGNYPAAQCPLCQIALDLIEVSKEASYLDKNEKLWRYALRGVLSFLLDGLRSNHLAVEGRMQDIDDRLVKQIIDGQQTKINAAENVIAAFIDMQAYRPGPGSPSPNSSGSRMFSNTRDSNISRNNINNVAGNLNIYSYSWQYLHWPVLALLTLVLLLVILHCAPRLSGKSSVV